MPADAAELAKYLHAQIPLSREMAISVVAADETGVRLAAPLAPNINHQNTAFGGSASALGILTAWTLVDFGLREQAIAAHVVIQRNSVEYLRPIRGEFQAFCPMPPAREWQRFVQTIGARGRGRIRLAAQLIADGQVVGTFKGDYVAFRAEEDSD